jgi:hypothetical protein|mmetsp:Transcript_25977/g.41771  ORF Transcript_25977/g.41771 Transcript_25977/m.41771 type:complete len:183 (-) Transcript_25977:172-720(-)
MVKRCNFLAIVVLSAFIGGLACSWTDDDSEEFYKMLIVGTVIGAIIGTICVIFICLPLCCGVMKAQGRIIAGVVMAIGIIICFIPAIAGKAQADGAVDKMCERCVASASHDACTEQEKSDAKDAVAALGILVAYIHAFGFAVVILGASAAGMACCVCCKCCAMKDAQADPVGVQGQVVGVKP